MSKINRDSEANQRIVRALVDREVHYCVSSLMWHFSQNPSAMEGSDYSYDDVLSLCSKYPDNSDEISELEDEISELEDSISETEDEISDHEDIVDDEDAEESDRAASLEAIETLKQHLESLNARLRKSEDEKSDLESEQDEPREAYEHWIVSDWAKRKLEEHGEMVGELFGLTIWGRTCSGQAIHLDGVWCDIAEEMGILKGQANEWSV